MFQMCLRVQAVEAEILTHYILFFTYFSKLLKLRFLTQYTLITYFSKPFEAEIFNAIYFAYLSF